MEQQRQQKALTECEYRSCRQPVHHIVYFKSGNIAFYCKTHSKQAMQLEIVKYCEPWKRD